MVDDENVVSELRKRYKDVPAIVFSRSVFRASTAGELFDILESIPDTPYCWDETKRRWSRTNDITCKSDFDFGIVN